MARSNGKARSAAGGGNSQSGSHDPITVVIADDRRSFGEALEIALDRESDLDVVSVVTDGADAIKQAVEQEPDVMLVDLTMSGVDGIETTRRLRERGAATAVIVLTHERDDVALARAIQAGARGVLDKTHAVDDLAAAIRRASRGEPLHDPDEVTNALRELRQRGQVDEDLERRVQRLTPRELEILQALADGSPPDRIATDLGMSKHTLRTHTQNILTKLGVHSKVEAIVAAIRFRRVRTPGVVRLPEAEETAPEGDLGPIPS
jgi:DNA-binding NarL/FixJ family response regulator